MESELQRVEQALKQAEGECIQATKNLKNLPDSSLALQLLQKAEQHPCVQREGQVLDKDTVLKAVLETMKYIRA